MNQVNNIKQTVMNKQRFPLERITVVAADGRKLSARWLQGENAFEHSVLFIPAFAAPQAYLQCFAAYLAQNGWGVMTFDYRGIGASKDDRLDSSVTVDDWVNLDIPAVVHEIKFRTKTQFLAVIAHSVGGQLFGQSPVRQEIDGALFISAQRGIPKLFKGMARLRIQYAYTVFPILIRIFGKLPISKWTLPQDCPNQALLQWMRWGRTGIFTDINDVNVEQRFADYKGSLTTITIADDQEYASAASVESLEHLYLGANIVQKMISPNEYGLDKIGHFGFFHRRAPQALWSQVEIWLKQLQLESGVAKSASL
jgi:predicted alpha/beta hydrolase